ncbi:MAG: DUF3024 domain-containing protein [Myxococcales bacterium]|nr:DUF3024 domain-containing protein [Deltaproteobacteria bacterium]NNE18363.1 DUF3024 domain-containing protein [Myxococcales bacterium]
MAFSELELKRIEEEVGGLCAARSPEHLRDEIRLEYRVQGHSIVIYEVRPRWGAPGELMEELCAKIRYVRTRKVWQLYWQRADLKWHLYEPLPEASRLGPLLKHIDEDPHSCFFG